MNEATGFVRQERDGAIGLIVLARPESRNALNSAMYREIADALRAFQADDAIRAIVLRGEGRDFCAGNDIGDFQAFGDRVATTGPGSHNRVDRTTPGVDLVYVLMELDKPLIASIQGNAIGFGATMLLHCDSVVAESDAQLRYPFVDLALVPEAGCTLLLKERVGFLKAAEILLNARAIDVTEALRLGLVSEVVANGSGSARAVAIAAALASKPHAALRATKRLLKRDGEPLRERVTEEFRVLFELMISTEARAVFARLLGKR